MTVPTIHPDLLPLARKIDDLVLDPVNARDHTPEKNRSIEVLRASLRIFGQRKPIVVQKEGMIVRAGNGLAMAAKLEGMEEIAAVVVDEDNVTATAFALADNRTAELSEWDEVVLAELVAELREVEDLDLPDLGFSDEDLDDLGIDLGGGGGDDGSSEPPIPPTPKSSKLRVGQVFRLGDNLLTIGDSREASTYERISGSVVAIVTDPPYGIGKDGIENDDEAGLADLYRDVLAAIPVPTATGAVSVAFQSPRLLPVWIDALRSAGWSFERILAFVREGTRAHAWRGWMVKSQPIVVATLGSPKWPKLRETRNSDVYEFSGLDPEGPATDAHPTVKPLAVVVDLVRHVPRGTIVEPFAGTGTTILAAERIGVPCYAIEIEPRYAEVAIERWENETGESAEEVT